MKSTDVDGENSVQGLKREGRLRKQVLVKRTLPEGVQALPRPQNEDSKWVWPDPQEQEPPGTWPPRKVPSAALARGWEASSDATGREMRLGSFLVPLPVLAPPSPEHPPPDSKSHLLSLMERTGLPHLHGECSLASPTSRLLVPSETQDPEKGSSATRRSAGSTEIRRDEGEAAAREVSTRAGQSRRLACIQAAAPSLLKAPVSQSCVGN